MRIYEEVDLLISEKHQATLLSYCAAMKIISEAKLSIYHKFLMAQRITTHLRLLRQLKFLTASKTFTVLDYPRNFGNAANYGFKCL